MKTIYLIRHSSPFVEIDNYNDYKNVSWEDYNRNMILSKDGEINAEKLCNIKELEGIKTIYASDSYRAIGTAKYIAELNKTKVKLDSRINERVLGIKKITDLPEGFSQKSFEDRNLKMENGESLNEVNKRFSDFINELLINESDKSIVVLHGIILMSYLQNISDFEFYEDRLKIVFNTRIVVDRKLRNPDVFKIVFDNKNSILSIENIEV